MQANLVLIYANYMFVQFFLNQHMEYCTDEYCRDYFVDFPKNCNGIIWLNQLRYETVMAKGILLP